MRLNNQQFHDYLLEQGVTNLYHANTVATALTYIAQRGLLSRGAVEARGLYQTPQDSDEIDKVVDVWNDVFFDSLDLHGYFPRQNIYGPVSFKYSLDIVLNENLHFWVTKNNPQYWTIDTPMQDRYFQSVDELREVGNSVIVYRKMIILKDYMQAFPFTDLVNINVDNPKVFIYGELDPIVVFANAIKALDPKPIELTGKFRLRSPAIECRSYCYCTDNYLRMQSPKLAKLFLPNDHPRFNG